jgi:sarcosine oxidase subunit gamma
MGKSRMSDHQNERVVRSYSGYVEVSEKTAAGMLTIRGDFRSSRFKTSFTKAVGTKLPKTREVILAKNNVAWMSPDELLILCDYADVSNLSQNLQTELKDQHHMLVNVSDARALFEVSGSGVREVIAKLAPVNISTLEIGEIRRTRFSQVAAAFWLTSETSLNVICFSSVADYMFNLLKTSSMPNSKVGDF